MLRRGPASSLRCYSRQANSSVEERDDDGPKEAGDPAMRGQTHRGREDRGRPTVSEGDPLMPKFGYRLDESDPDVLVLRRRDGSFVWPPSAPAGPPGRASSWPPRRTSHDNAPEPRAGRMHPSAQSLRTRKRALGLRWGIERREAPMRRLLSPDQRRRVEEPVREKEERCGLCGSTGLRCDEDVATFGGGFNIRVLCTNTGARPTPVASAWPGTTRSRPTRREG